MISQGHDPDRVLDYTIEQLNLFAHFAAERINREMLSSAQTAAIGSAVGFTGQTDILKKFGQDLGVEMAKSSAVPASVRNLLMHAVHATRTANKQAEDGGN